jgi:hypothetical protein
MVGYAAAAETPESVLAMLQPVLGPTGYWRDDASWPDATRRDFTCWRT